MISSVITCHDRDKNALGALVRVMLKRHGKCRVVEVGSWYGETAVVLSKAGATEVFCVDHWFGSDDPNDHQAVEHKRFSRNDVWKTWCHNTVELGNIFAVTAPSLEAAKIDWKAEMVFIDADHSYKAVKADIEAWSKQVVPGGVLCGHDFGMFSGVRKAVQESGDYETLTEEIWVRRM